MPASPLLLLLLLSALRRRSIDQRLMAVPSAVTLSGSGAGSDASRRGATNSGAAAANGPEASGLAARLPLGLPPLQAML